MQIDCGPDYAYVAPASNASVERVSAAAALPPPGPLQPVRIAAYDITSPFWRKRAKSLIVHWIPHCVSMIEAPGPARKSAGHAGAAQAAPLLRNAWLYHNTIEAMCLALAVDPQGDAEIIVAQDAMRKKLEEWIPKILGTQDPDGYLRVRAGDSAGRRWTNKKDHEGYQAGYFIDAAIAHHVMTGGRDRRLFDAAIRLADCWERNIGPPPKRAWYDGHQGIEQALVSLAGYVDGVDGKNAGRKYVALAKFLLDQRGKGEEYDQSHLPVTKQFTAVGHAVRAVYGYNGMAGVAMVTGDAAYHAAVQALWGDIVHRKYYVTGGIGSGETSEGFGAAYSLPNSGYCESCSSCGFILFQHTLQRTWQDARYADVLEETLYNALLGSMDLEGKNFTYTNPLDSSEKRYPWHNCPCCIGNIPRTLLNLPAWVYTKGPDAVCVNLYVGSRVDLGAVAGNPLQIVQATDYPWSGNVALTINPAAPANFALKLRVPGRQVSELYASTPAVTGLVSLAVNGERVTPLIERGYAVLSRAWKAGDTVELELPMDIQRVRADRRVTADAGRVALRRGPLVYNIENVDQGLGSTLDPAAPLAAAWRGDLLDGVMVIQGTFRGGKPLLAIPNYARLNRGGRSIVWLKDGK